MANSKKKKALGRGLGALIKSKPAGEQVAPIIQDTATATTDGQPDELRLLELDPHLIKPNPKQPRMVFDEDALEELAASIRHDGVQEPVIVRFHKGEYQLVSGERRVRASIMADQATIPAVCRDISDSEMLRLGIIENLQREDLNAIELAQAYQRLLDEFHWTQEEMAEQVGKKRATVANTLRLLNLAQPVQDHVAAGDISMGHARALLALESPEQQMAVCKKVISEGLSVRQTEKLAAPKAPKKPASPKDPNLASVEDELRRRLGTKVNLRHSNNNKGRIEIEYFDLDELERLLEILRAV